MFVGWRMGDDLELLSELPSGTISLDLLTGKTIHEKLGKIKLGISQEICLWLIQHFSENNIDKNKIESATLIVEMDTDKIHTDKKHVVSFNWKCQSTIKTNEKVYEGKLFEKHQWHNRSKE